MKSESGITFEGKKLEEYLVDKEQLISEFERKKLISETSDKKYLYHPSRIKQSEHKEKNGKVKHLGNREKNQAICEAKLKEFIEKDDYRSACVVVLFGHPELTKFLITQIEDFINQVTAKFGMTQSKNLKSRVRVHLSNIAKKSALNECIIFYPKRNSMGRVHYEVRESCLNELTIDEAIEFARIPIKKEDKKPVIKINIDPPEKSENDDVQINPMPPSDDLQDIVLRLLKNGSNFNFFGDIHVHVNRS